MKWTHPCQLLEKHDAFILDAFGVFWSGAYVFDSAKEFMKLVVESGKPLIVLSNATQLAGEEMAKYASFGLIQGIHYHALLTSGEISKQLALVREPPFEASWKAYYAAWSVHPKFGCPHHSIFEKSAYEQVDQLEEADFIYLNTPYFKEVDQTDPEIFEEELNRLAAYRLPVICPNPDEFAQHGEPPRFVVRQGSIALRLERKGVDVRYIGKPGKVAFDKAKEIISEVCAQKPSSILMIGDNPRTDIQGANELGMSSALIVETGVLNHLYSDCSVDDLLQILQPEQIPNYFLKVLTSA